MNDQASYSGNSLSTGDSHTLSQMYHGDGQANAEKLFDITMKDTLDLYDVEWYCVPLSYFDDYGLFFKDLRLFLEHREVDKIEIVAGKLTVTISPATGC